jgi:flagellar biosynthesis protein
MKKDNNYTRKVAVALSYHPDSADAPVLTAKGSGKTAEKIIEKAHEHQIPIQEDPSLVNLLGKLDINERIPDELFQAVAEVFAFIYKMDQESKNEKKQE